MSGCKPDQPYYDTILKYSGRISLLVLLTIYIRAASRGVLFTNPDWTISNVMIYDFNQILTHCILFPCFLVICVVYSLKRTVVRIRLGSIVAIVGGIGLIWNPVTTNPKQHLICAFVVFLSSYFWYPECTVTQLNIFLFSATFFFGGFLMDNLMDNTNLSFVKNEITSFIPSIICMVGEYGIFLTWGNMVQNPFLNKNKK